MPPARDAPTGPARSPAPSVRERILVEAARMAVETGWRQVRMAAVAAAAGVSRQTVHAHFATKENLARGLLDAQVRRVVGLAVAALEAHPDGEVGPAIVDAVQAVLDEGRRNALLAVVLDSAARGDPELLRLLTADAAPVYRVVWDAVGPWALRNVPGVPLPDVAAIVDVVARVVVSHLVQPGPSGIPVARTLAGMTQEHIRRLTAG